jgi:NAD(P)-dependent dehydrogenase (short-subunit alcohol dehydrogenase family)
MTDKLKGKVAVITGSGGGIGREVALAMVAEGASVVINDINKELADETINDIKKAGGKAAVNYDSVVAMAGGENIIKTATSNFGRIDILVNCAGFLISAPAVEVEEKDWDAIIAVHLKGHFACTQPAIKEMIKQKSGRIINISSRAGFRFSWSELDSLPLATAKAGVAGFTALLSAELKQYGITVNAILPSAITKNYPAKRPTFGGAETASADFVAPIIVYLATDEAKNITGQYFYAGGGDICIFPRPLQLDGANKFIRKMGKWTVDELNSVIPPLLGSA